MANFFNVNIEKAMYNRSIVNMMVLNGNVIYTSRPIYKPKEFKQEYNITEVDTLVTSKHTDLSEMFSGCTNLISVNTEDWNTSNVTDISYMFYNCYALTSLNVSNWDTSNVTNMDRIFSGCNNLTELDLDNWDTSKVTSMNGTFYNCKSLTILDISNFDMSNVSITAYMFGECTNLHTLFLDNCSSDTISKIINSLGFPTNSISGVTRKIYCRYSEVGDMMPPEGWRFSYIDVADNDDPSNPNPNEPEGTARYTPWEFAHRSDVVEVATIVDSGHDDLSEMFFCCNNLRKVNSSRWDTSNVTTMCEMFDGCQSLPTLNVSNFDTSKVTDMQYMFYLCKSLPSLDVSNFNTDKVTDMKWMFANCQNLRTLNVRNFNTSNVTNMSYMFSNLYKVTLLNVSNFDTNKVTDMHEMFSNCESLTSLDLSKWNTSKVTDMGYMFIGCHSLIRLDLGGWDLDNIIELPDRGTFGMLYDCWSLRELHLEGCSYDTVHKIINSYAFPINAIEETTRTIYCDADVAAKLTAPANWVFSPVSDESEIPGPEVPEAPDTRPLYVDKQFTGDAKITTANVIVNTSHKDLGNMFNGCTDLVSVNTEGWDTSNVTNMLNMFNGCKSLVTLDLSNFNTSNVTNMNWMFLNCSKLETLDMRNFDTSKATANMRDIFYKCSSLHILYLNNCSADTISRIITQSSFPADNAGTIYCSRVAAAGLEEPGNWRFSYID